MKIEIKDLFTGEVIFTVQAADLTNAKLTNAKLVNADLEYADLSGAKLTGAKLRGAKLTNAKLTNAKLVNADLEYAKLTGADLYGADLRYADLYGADLRDANLTGADLKSADLRDAKLRGADLKGAIGLPNAPIVTNLHSKMAEITAASGSLDMSNWHTCETTHCRAGWAIHLAGEEGYELEEEIGPSTAGALIYFASTGIVPDFHASNNEALEDIRRLAND